MSSTFTVLSRRRWTFQLVLLGARLQLEGWCEPLAPPEEPLRCSAWMEPLQDPRDVAHGLMERPRCAL